MSSGQWVVLFIVGAALLGCTFTWFNYSKMRPSSLEGEVVNVSPAEIRVKFPAWVIEKVEPGAVAWVSSSDTKSKGAGLVVEKSDTVLVRITDPQFSPALGETCQVTLNLEKPKSKP